MAHSDIRDFRALVPSDDGRPVRGEMIRKNGARHAVIHDACGIGYANGISPTGILALEKYKYDGNGRFGGLFLLFGR